ncbi:uncharacterized protein [Pocillopora verrucosa]|uniref:uncharacterized protein isoform X1 n=2 Tax=Pocillopora verrucosa TaxID=203993 RepID=UPI00333F3CDB
MLHHFIALFAVAILSSCEGISSPHPAIECTNHTVLNEASRSRFFTNYIDKTSDTSLTGWFTYNGSAGTRMATTCVPAEHCGTLVPGWLAGNHPSVDEGLVVRSVCLSMSQVCCMTSVSVLVRNCSGFFVYKLDVNAGLSFTFRVCGAGIEGSLPPKQVAIKNKLVGDECSDYNTLNARDRAADYFSYNTLKCDAYLPSGWYKLAGRAGTVMPTHCVPRMHCGTLSPGWLNGKHPTVEEGVVQRMVCFTNDTNCCHWYSLVLVKNCSGFMVYKFGHFPTSVDSCSMRYCGAGEAGCRDKEGNSYDVWQSWNPNPLFKCTCAPNLKVECQKTESGCWDSHGNAFVDGHEWLSDNMTKCTCSYGKITCTKLSRPACTDEKGMVRDHGTHWFSGVCFNCSCVDGLISCAKYRVTIKYGLFQVETIGRCIPCHQPSNDILPTGDGTVAACQVFFQLKALNEVFGCSSGHFVRKEHVCNGVAECPDASDEAQCQNVICRDEEGQILILKDVWKVSDCLSCECTEGRLKCKRTLQVNFPGKHLAYVPFNESCEQPGCNAVEFIKARRETCEVIETVEGGHILSRGDNWDYKGCQFLFEGHKQITGCPQMSLSTCYIYNGAVCCAEKCPALPQLASQVRWGMMVCPGGLQLIASDDQCDIIDPSCLPGNGSCKTDDLCQDEDANTYINGSTWSIGDCIDCYCHNGVISCSKTLSVIISNDENTERCSQPDCNVAAFLKANRGICKVCIWRNQTHLEGYRWTENGVDFFCSSEKQRVRPGCYLKAGHVQCTGAFTGVRNLSLISDERLYLCKTGDEIRSLNDRCDQKADCRDKSDERDCVQYFCPFYTKFNMYWERTALNEIVVRNCSEMDPELGGNLTNRCSSPYGDMTKWSFKESCFCEKKSLRQEVRHKLSIVNLTKILELTRAFVNKATNFTNKELFFNYLSLWFKSGALLLNPVNHSNDMVALNFSQAIFQTTRTENVFKPHSDSVCPEEVTYSQRWSLIQDIKEFVCGASNLTHTFRFCFTLRSLKYKTPPIFTGDGNNSPNSPGVTNFWMRPVLNLRIDPNQLSSGSDTVGSLSLPPGNITSEMNFSRVLVPLQRFNCAWIEYDVNGTLKITAKEVRDEEKERKAMVKTHLDLVLSSISSVVVIICLILLSCLRIRNSERIFVHKNLLISICLVYILMIFDSCIFTNRKQTPKLCSAMAVLQHITHTAIFTWMLVEGIHLYIKLVKVFSVHKLYITYIVIGWGLPVVTVGLIAAIRPVTYDMSKTYYKDVMCGSLKLSAEIIRDRCWLNDGEWLYKGPVLAILVVNLVIFVILLRVIFTKISKKYQTDNVEKTRKGLRSIAALLPLLGVTWLLGFFIHWSEVLAYLFIILNSSQGLVFCIFHGVLDDQVRESLLRSTTRTRLGMMTQIGRSSIVSATTQLSPAGSINGRANMGQRPGIAGIKHIDTKL